MLSIVIPVFNNEGQLGAQLEAVLAQEAAHDFEVVVADNGSTDGSREVAGRYGRSSDKVRVVDASGRRGPGAARNAGVVAARSERVFFCDADDVVQKGWLASLDRALDTCDIAVGGLDVYSLNGQPPGPVIDPSPPHFHFLPAGLGANMAVRRTSFDSVQGFNEELRVGEDLDLCWRMQLAGLRLERHLEAVVAKREGSLRDGRLVAQSLGYGRSDVVLYRRYRSAGMPRRPGQAAKAWAWLALNSWSVLRPDRRKTWARALFINIGHLVGSIEQRTFYP